MKSKSKSNFSEETPMMDCVTSSWTIMEDSILNVEDFDLPLSAYSPGNVEDFDLPLSAYSPGKAHLQLLQLQNLLNP